MSPNVSAGVTGIAIAGPLEGVTATGGVTALVAGFALGTFFFWTLWWTSRRVLHARSPALLLGISFVVRMAVLIGGIWFVTRGRLLEAVISVIGVLIARSLVLGAVRRSGGGGD